MNNEQVIFRTLKREVKIPNRWELLPMDHYVYLVSLLARYACGAATADDVRLHYTCHAAEVDLSSVQDPEALGNLMIIADHVDFIFTPSGKVNLSFLAQLVPELEVKVSRFRRKRYRGYEVNTGFGTLTCSLTAAQFIDAKQLLDSQSTQLPLLAAILYCPTPYSGEKAHALAGKLANVNPTLLQAVSFNFQALITFLFTRTRFSVLASGVIEDNVPEIATGIQESMYNLSADGMGDVNAVKQMPLIEFLTIIRKKLIESVRAMHFAKVNIVEIAGVTGLPINTIKKMI